MALPPIGSGHCFPIPNLVPPTNYQALSQEGLLALADSRDRLAQFHFAQRCQNPERSFEYFRRAAEQKLPEAEFAVGWCYFTGYGVSQDIGVAKTYFSRAAQKSQVDALMYLGLIENNLEHLLVAATLGQVRHKHECAVFILANSDALQPYVNQALGYLYEAAHQNYPPAMVALSHCLYEGIGLKKNEQEAFAYLEKAARTGDPEAVYRHAAANIFGRGCAVNGELGWDIMRQIAKQGNLWAKEFIEKADQLFVNLNIRAQDGEVDAHFQLAAFYASGAGNTKQDMKQSIACLTLAAQADHPEACFLLGKCYLYGKGVALDYQAASNWLAKAVDLGIQEAERFQKYAHFLLIKAQAEQGVGAAQFELSRLYAENNDLVQSRIFLEKSADAKHVLAQIALGSLSVLSPKNEQDFDRGVDYLTAAYMTDRGQAIPAIRSLLPNLETAKTTVESAAKKLHEAYVYLQSLTVESLENDN